jgi:hypothetical protein
MSVSVSPEHPNSAAVGVMPFPFTPLPLKRTVEKGEARGTARVGRNRYCAVCESFLAQLFGAMRFAYCRPTLE